MASILNKMTKKSQSNSQPKIIGIIPARYASSRFPGKILAPIMGKTLIQRTYEAVCACDFLDKIIIATDDARIFSHVNDFGAYAVMTSPGCPTGTDRIIEAINRDQELKTDSIIINIQGDEPCISPDVIQKVGEILIEDPEAVMSTAAVKLESQEEFESRSVVKCALDLEGNALYFSRSAIGGGHRGVWDPDLPVFRHMGIYGYRRGFLLHYGTLPQTPLQKAEDLEQLKVIEHGFRIKVALVEHFSIGVDIPDDIKKVEQWLCKQNISSSQAESVPL